jgi:hypothetical protein
MVVDTSLLRLSRLMWLWATAMLQLNDDEILIADRSAPTEPERACPRRSQSQRRVVGVALWDR